MDPGAIVLPGGLRVAVTRPAIDAAVMANALRLAGAHPLLYPLTQVLPPDDPAPLRRATENISDFDWIVFTSANGVRALANSVTEAALAGSGPTTGTRAGPVGPEPGMAGTRPATAGAGPVITVTARIAAVGPATAAAVRLLLGVVPVQTGTPYTAHGLARALSDIVADARVLWPRSALADDTLLLELSRAGARVQAPVAYNIQPDRRSARALADAVEAGDIDVLSFTAPSAVASFRSAGGAPGDSIVAVIGPRTGSAARAAGWRVHVEADSHDVTGLIAGIAQQCRETGRNA